MLTTVGMENRPMEGDPDSVDFFKDWFWVTASVVGVCGFLSRVVLYEVLGLTVNDGIKKYILTQSFTYLLFHLKLPLYLNDSFLLYVDISE